jgi:hypothetical protein
MHVRHHPPACEQAGTRMQPLHVEMPCAASEVKASCTSDIIHLLMRRQRREQERHTSHTRQLSKTRQQAR